MYLRRALQGLLVSATATALLVSTVSVERAAAADDGWAAPADSQSVDASSGCADYLYIGVRGSGETKTWGSTVDNAQIALRKDLARLGGLRGSVRTVYINYTAASVSTLVGDLGSLGVLKRYTFSVLDGYKKLRKILADSYEGCKNRTDEKWIIAGYSQGALVVSQVLSDLTPAARKQVAGAQLIADPANWKGRSLVRLGHKATQRGRGVWRNFTDWWGSRSRWLRSSTASATAAILCATSTACRRTGGSRGRESTAHTPTTATSRHISAAWRSGC